MSHAKSIAEIEVAWHLWQENIKPHVIARRVNKDRATIYRWIKRFKTIGLRRTLRAYEHAKKGRRRKRIPIETKLHIFLTREKYNNCCGEKIRYYMQKDYKERVSVATIYRVLRTRYKMSSKYKQRKYGEAPKGSYERDVIQVDTVDFGQVYAYTYIDTYTRQAYVDLETGLESEDGYASLTMATRHFKKVRLLQNDGGGEFEKEFKKNVKMFAKEHRVSRAYKKNEQSFIESFNRTLRKECLGWRKYKIGELPRMREKVKKYLNFYNNERPHLGLGMKIPNDVAACRI